MERSEERAAKNETAFRSANEHIAKRRSQLDRISDPTPFLCECENPECTELVRVDLEDYQAVRSDPVQFLIVPGHPTRGTATALAGDGWVCVRKEGLAAEIAIAREQET